MIYGIGTDMARIERFDALLARHGLRCGQRLLAESERAELALAKQPARFLAKRFAAKEALGKPMFAFSDPLQAFLHQRGICAVHLSISDEQQHAFAFVVCESALAANP